MNSTQPPHQTPEQGETIRIRRPQQQAFSENAPQPTIVISRPSPSVNIGSSLVSQARDNDPQAIATMFRQFAPEDEPIYFAEYLGVEGLWGLGTHSFACLTNRRIAAIRVGVFGEVTYQDGYLEFLNSGVIYQPSKLKLYLMAFGQVFFALLLVLNSLLQLPTIEWVAVVPLIIVASAVSIVASVRLFYRFYKCGLVWVVREGVSIYVFTNRKRLGRANHLYRLCTQFREKRYAELLNVL